MALSPRLLTTLLLLAVVTNSACLFRSHKVASRISGAPLQSAAQEELITRLNRQAGQVHTLNATVDISTSVGGEKKGKVTDLTEIRGYILISEPTRMLRFIGLVPVVRSRAFDMVSDGEHFKLWIPARNRFITGANEITTPSKNPLENLRPQVLRDAVLPRAIDPQNEIAVLESGTRTVEEGTGRKRRTLTQSDYRLNVVRRGSDGTWRLERRLYYERETLTLYRQRIYDEHGNLATEATYGSPQDFNGASFPVQITIVRPQEEYTITLRMVKLTFNEDLKPDQFDLPQPTGAQVTVLGNGSAGAGAGQTQK